MKEGEGMKQGTIAFLILLEAALVLGLVYYTAGGYRAFLGSSGSTPVTEVSSGTDLVAAGGSESVSANVPDGTVSGNGEAEEDPNVLPAGMEWGLQYQDYYLSSGTGELSLSSRHEYDVSGRLVRITYYMPEEFSEDYSYDADGNLTHYARTDASGRIVRTGDNYYDEEGRLSRCAHYEEDRLLAVIAYLYDDEGREWREVWYSPKPTALAETLEENSVSGNEAQTDTVSGNAAETDEAPELVAGQINEYKYDEDGNIIKYWSFFADGKIAGPWEEYEYDENGRMSALIHRESDGSLLARQTYTYYSEDKVSSVLSTDANGAVFWRHYRDYDTQGRLIHAEVRDEETLVTWELYQYDENGRLTEKCDNAGEILYIYDENTGMLTATERYANVGVPASEDNMTARTEYFYQPVPEGTAYLPED